MAEWLEQASQWHEMYCHDDLEAMSSNPGQVDLGVGSTSVYVVPQPKIPFWGDLKLVASYKLYRLLFRVHV